MAGPIQGYQFDGFPLGVPAVSVGASRQGEGRNECRPPGGDARTLMDTCMQWEGIEDLKWARDPTLLVPY